MPIRSSLSDAARRSQTGVSRATIREIDDNHLMQEVKQADVMHSESPTNFERMQMVGLTSVPMKQKEEKKQGQQQAQQGGGGGAGGEWNHDQPKGEAAEAIMLYANGQRSHPIALVDDRRVRPYAMKEGETALYAADGSGQMALHKKDGFYLVSLDDEKKQDQSGKETQKEQKRFVSMRHVNKKKQSRKIEKDKKPEDPKHEGESVNTEVRCTKDRIEFRAGDAVVGYYEKSSETWFLQGKIVAMKAATRIETVGPTHLGLDNRGETGPKVVTEDGPAKQTWAKT